MSDDKKCSDEYKDLCFIILRKKYFAQEAQHVYNTILHIYGLDEDTEEVALNLSKDPNTEWNRTHRRE